MNTKENQRYSATKNRIKGIFLNLLKEKEINRITVTEICREAHIHRTTFYGHYEDIYALLQELIGEMYEQMMGYFLSCDRGEGFEKLFTMIQGQKNFFRQYFEYCSPSHSQQVPLPVPLIQSMQAVMDEMGFESEEELYYHQIFFSCGLIGMIRRWIMRDCKETPQEMCRIIESEYRREGTQWK